MSGDLCARLSGTIGWPSCADTPTSRRIGERATRGCGSSTTRTTTSFASAERVDRLRLILSALQAAGQIEDMLHQVPFLLRPLGHEYEGFWAVKVTSNW
jgi:hypothetical protein